MRFVLFLFALLWTGSASADAVFEEARAAYLRGRDAFMRADYELALQEFRHADTLNPQPSLAYDLALSYEHLGREAEALAEYRRFLDTPPVNANEAQVRARVRARLDADPKDFVRPAPLPATPAKAQALAAPYPYSNLDFANYVQQARMLKIKQAEGRRGRAIALMTIGLVLDVVGAALLIDSYVNIPSGFASAPIDSSTGAEAFFGTSMLIVGPTLWIPGAVSYARAQRIIDEPDRVGLPPQAMILKTPTLRF